MKKEIDALATERKTLNYDLGTFEGFNFRDQCAIEGNKTAEEVVNWDHDRQGEAEFWPSGDREEVQLVFRGRSSVTGTELLALDRLLEELGRDSKESFLMIYSALSSHGGDLCKLDAEAVEDEAPQIYFGESFCDVRKAAAYELFELYYPEEFKVWEKSRCDGLIFDPDRFLDSPSFSVDELKLGGSAVLLVSLA